MIKRTIEISQQAAYLSVSNRQLLIHARDGEGTRELLGQAPCEDVGVLLVDHPAVTYSHAALTALLENDAAVVLCGRDHLPAGLLLPIGEHSQVVWRINEQIAAPKPLCKRLWRQIIQAKIRAQAMNLAPGSATRTKLLALVRNVRSGDPANVEAQAARAYWAAWGISWAAHAGGTPTLPNAGETPNLPTGGTPMLPFRRDPDGAPPNNLLNYGYAVMRAAVARAIVAAGLLPALGLRHHNRSNAFCLADDLVEPLRPMVDARVAQIRSEGAMELTPDTKRVLLELLAAETIAAEQSGPLMVALHRYAASLVKCFRGEAKSLDIPVAIEAGG